MFKAFSIFIIFIISISLYVKHKSDRVLAQAIDFENSVYNSLSNNNYNSKYIDKKQKKQKIKREIAQIGHEYSEIKLNENVNQLSVDTLKNNFTDENNNNNNDNIPTKKTYKTIDLSSNDYLSFFEREEIYYSNSDINEETTVHRELASE